MGNIPVLRWPNGHSKRCNKRRDSASSFSCSTSSASRQQQQQQQQRQKQHHVDQYVFGTLCLNSYADVFKALKKDCTSKGTTMLVPRKIQVGGKFLNTMTDFPSSHHKRSLRRVLRRGCVDLVLVGNNPQAPRRVYDVEVTFVLERLQHDMIEGIYIENLDLQERPQQGQALATTNHHILLDNLRKFSNLERIVIKSSRMGNTMLRDLLSALEKLSGLREVTLNLLDLKDDQMETVEGALARLLQTSVVLESISLPNYPTTDDFWNAVASSQSLRSLSLPCEDATRTGGDVVRVHQLLEQDTHLESLQLRQIHPTIVFGPLANALNENTQLEKLTLTLEDHHSATTLLEHMTPIFRNHNFTLNQFELYRDVMPGETNIRIPTPIIDFYTQLNRHSAPNQGRSYLLRQGDPTGEEWKQVLEDAASEANVSALYYWLRVQPTLITAMARSA